MKTSDEELERMRADAIARADLVALVQADGIRLRSKGREHRGLCPFHDDHSPSLAIYSKDGRQRFRCFSCGKSGDAIDWVREKRHKTYEEAVRELSGSPPSNGTARQEPPSKVYRTAREALAAMQERSGKAAGWWVYEDSARSPVCLMVRWDEPGGGKWFLPLSRFGAEDWRARRLPGPHPLYRLPELLAADPGGLVFVCEGEKCADAARRCGLVATTTPSGANALRGEGDWVDWAPLRGRRLCILPDADEPGEQYAADFKRCALRAGAREVRIVRLRAAWASIPPGGDIADLLAERGGSEAAAVALGAEVLALAEGAQAEATSSGEPAGGEDRPDEAEPAEPQPAPASPEAPAAGLDRPSPFRPFPIDALPEPLARFVAEASGSIGCEASMVALPLLASIAAAVGNARCCEVKPDWTEPAIVWAVVVGESGCGKSPAARAALRFIRDRERRLGADHAAALAAFEEARREHEQALARWQRSKQGEQPAEPGEAPRRPRILTTDATVEALAELMQHNPRGLLLARDELAGLLAGFDKYTAGRGGDAQKYLEAWDGGCWIVDRKQSAGARVEPVSLSITGGIQPAILRAMLEERRSQHRENGLAARMLIAFPPRRPQRWSDRSASPEAAQAVEAVFERLLALELHADEWGGTSPRRIALDPAAREVFIAHHDALAGETADLGGHLAAVYSKLRSYLARLALLFHLVRRAEGDPGAGEAIDAASVRSAARLVDWFGAEARRFEQAGEGAEGLPDPEVDIFEVERIALDQGGEVTARHLYDRGKARFRPMAKAREALRAAAAAGVGRIDRRRKTGAREVEWLVLTGATGGDEAAGGDGATDADRIEV